MGGAGEGWVRERGKGCDVTVCLLTFVLQHLNNLSMHMNLQEYLVYAELLYTSFAKKTETDPQFVDLRDFMMGN